MNAPRYISYLCGLVLVAGAVTLVGCGPKAQSSPTIEFNVKVTDEFKIIPDRIDCQPGQTIRIRVTNSLPVGNTDLPHNLVFLNSETNVDAFGEAAVTAEAEANYLPPNFIDKVFAYTQLVHSGATAELTFTAPKTRGTFPIVCAFPGHCLLGMRGNLIVH